MASASDRVGLIGLSLADAHKISDELRRRSLDLREASCKLAADPTANPCIAAALDAERQRVLAVREILTSAISETLQNLG